MADYQLGYMGAEINTKLGGGHTINITSAENNYTLYYADGTNELKYSGTTGTFNNVVALESYSGKACVSYTDKLYLYNDGWSIRYYSGSVTDKSLIIPLCDGLNCWIDGGTG